MTAGEKTDLQIVGGIVGGLLMFIIIVLAVGPAGCNPVPSPRPASASEQESVAPYEVKEWRFDGGVRCYSLYNGESVALNCLQIAE